MLKKACAVGAIALGLSLVSTPAFASPVPTPPVSAAVHHAWGDILFADAYRTFIHGGADLGRGAGEVVAGAYAGIATTAQEVLHTLEY